MQHGQDLNGESSGRPVVPLTAPEAVEQDPVEAGVVRRGLIRFLVVVLDCSESMNQRDMRPSRMEVVAQVVKTFIDNFFDQNPISQLAIIELRDSAANRITELSGNARNHKAQLDKQLRETRNLGKGKASIRAGLERAHKMLESQALQALYGTKEVLFVYGSLSSVDRGNVFEMMEKMNEEKIKVSCVGLAAELFVAKTICKNSGGNYKVATHVTELRDMILEHTTPAVILQKQNEVITVSAYGMWVGLAKRRQGLLQGWECPRCHVLAKDVPSDCEVCSLKLLSSSHLARSYHHLFPVSPFRDKVMENQEQHCRACGRLLPHGKNAFSCRRCQSMFCRECDGFIHEMLHVCPGCEGNL